VEIDMPPASPQDIIRRLSARFGVPVSFGQRMLPLLERATALEGDPRKRILDLVERSYAHEAELRRSREPPSPEEQRVLSTVAGILHGWEPPGWLDGIPGRKPRRED